MERAIITAAEPMLRAFADTAQTLLERDMPIIINVPEAPPAVVNVAAPIIHVAAPQVNVEALLPPAQVNGPKTSTQRVERSSDGEILQTVTTHAY
jgi:hypothetical protein